MKRVKREVTIQCPKCSGLGRKAGTNETCGTCGGNGEVSKWIVEIVHDDEAVKT